MTPSNIDTLIHAAATLLWLFAGLGACVYVVRLLAKHETSRTSGYTSRRTPDYIFGHQPRPHLGGHIGTPPTGGSVVKRKGGQR